MNDSFSKYRSLAALLVANTLPVFGVLFWGWDLFAMLILYWVESMIIGIWNIPKMILASGEGTTLKNIMVRMYGAVGYGSVPSRKRGIARFFLVPFFMFHYGMFMFGHLVFLLAFRELAALGIQLAPGLSFSGTLSITPYFEKGFLIAVLSLFVSHGISFFSNYIGKKEYLSISTAQQMMRPYRRIVVMHITILIGVFASIFFGSSTGFLLVFWTMKVLVDVSSHIKERGWREKDPVIHFDAPLLLLMRKLVGVDFAVAGSLNLAIQGVEGEVPRDIDIITDADGMKLACSVFGVVPYGNGTLTAAKFPIEGMEIHLIHDRENKFRGTYFKNEMVFIPYGTLSIPCMTLQSELRYYEQSDQKKYGTRVRHIKEALMKRQNI